MKSAKAAPSDASSAALRRSQPVRQTRTNPSRNAATLSGSTTGRNPSKLTPAGDHAIDIFPAISHFTDTITALPKELVRHFTLLKEVDAKLFIPEDQLFKLVNEASNSPLLESRPRSDDSSGRETAVLPASAPAATTVRPAVCPTSSTGGPVARASDVFDPCNIPRRQLFRQTAFKIQEMLVSLDEKNHVITTANEALQRQLARIEDVWPYLENEFSEEAKWGSITHWAYPENRNGKASHAERARRDGAAAISAAAQALADEAAARSDARKQAVQAKRNQKSHHHDSDMDDHDGRQKGENSKKSHGSKSRKTADASSTGSGNLGSSVSNGNPPAKRRKVEKPVGGAAAVERSTNTASGNNANKAKTTSPRGTPAPDGSKKRKALPSGNNQNRKKYGLLQSPPFSHILTPPLFSPLFFLAHLERCWHRANGAASNRNGVSGMSPSAASSPVMGVFPPETKVAGRLSPGAPNMPRPTSSRARQNSIQSNTDNGRARPPSSASIKPNGNTMSTPDPASAVAWPRSGGGEMKPLKEAGNVGLAESNKEGDRPDDNTGLVAGIVRKEGRADEGTEFKSEDGLAQVFNAGPVTTKSGRTSKPSTPSAAVTASQDLMRPRSSRAADNGGGSKKSQRKGGASSAAQVLIAQALDDDTNSSIQGDDEDGEIDADEPTYCYCNSVSYGEMVACDADGCEREWFHLACVGLKVAPGSKSEWQSREGGRVSFIPPPPSPSPYPFHPSGNPSSTAELTLRPRS